MVLYSSGNLPAALNIPGSWMQNGFMSMLAKRPQKIGNILQHWAIIIVCIQLFRFPSVYLCLCDRRRLKLQPEKVFRSNRRVLRGRFQQETWDQAKNATLLHIHPARPHQVNASGVVHSRGSTKEGHADFAAALCCVVGPKWIKGAAFCFISICESACSKIISRQPRQK